MGVKNWKLAGNNLDPLVDVIQRKFALPRPIALFFAARGIKEEEVQDFLNPRLANLSDPYRFPGIQDAAKRLWDAIANKETILIHGDYDTDGITASALLRGARGNSGVILSLLFRGMSKSLKGCVTADGCTFAAAMQEGVSAAYNLSLIHI